MEFLNESSTSSLLIEHRIRTGVSRDTRPGFDGWGNKEGKFDRAA
jgi:hypothetical protein